MFRAAASRSTWIRRAQHSRCINSLRSKKPSRYRRYNRTMNQNSGRLLPVSLDSCPVIEAYKEGVDRTLLRENLKLTTTERVEKMIAAGRFAEAVRNSCVKADS